MRLTLPQYRLDRFVRSDDSLIADLSDGIRAGRMYDDACDMGFDVIGKTRTVTFMFSHESRCDRENELLSLTFVPIEEHRNQPINQIILFND
jgi:hypothetical protein